VAWGETSEAAITVVRKGIEAHGVPQLLLSDNGVALNPSRRGALGQLVSYVTSLGVEPITGKPYKPTTQGKNERDCCTDR
jgi:putative transposase